MTLWRGLGYSVICFLRKTVFNERRNHWLFMSEECEKSSTGVAVAQVALIKRLFILSVTGSMPACAFLSVDLRADC